MTRRHSAPLLLCLALATLLTAPPAAAQAGGELVDFEPMLKQKSSLVKRWRGEGGVKEDTGYAFWGTGPEMKVRKGGLGRFGAICGCPGCFY